MYKAHSDYVSSLAFGENNELFSAGPDGTIAIWDYERCFEHNRFIETFDNDLFDCKNLDLTNVEGLSPIRINHLLDLGAIVR